MLEKEKKEAQAVLSARKTIESGKRMTLKGKHLVSTDEICQEVEKWEKATKERKNKRRKSATTLMSNASQNQVEDALQVEIFDSITVEQNKE